MIVLQVPIFIDENLAKKDQVSITDILVQQSKAAIQYS